MRKGHRGQETGVETLKNVKTEETSQCSPGKTKSALSGDKSQERKAVFLPGRSCTDQVLTLTLVIKATINKQKDLPQNLWISSGYLRDFIMTHLRAM